MLISISKTSYKHLLAPARAGSFLNDSGSRQRGGRPAGTIYCCCCCCWLAAR